METSIRLGAVPQSARHARHHLIDFARQWDLPIDGAAEAIVAELVANAVRHGREPIVVSMSYEPGVLRIAVHDEAPGVELVAIDHSRPGELEGGMGLLLVDALTSAWGAEADADGGKTVWAECRDPGAEPG
jgi:anti-sigma regulatory factor (Ser/Thr protein kinase)